MTENHNTQGGHMPDERSEIQRLIAESSLGSPGARAVQRHSSAADVDHIMGLIAAHDVTPPTTATAPQRCSGMHIEPKYCSDRTTRPDQFAKLLADLRRQLAVEQDNTVVAWRSYRATESFDSTCHLTFIDSQQRINNAHRIWAFVSATSVNTPSRWQRATAAAWRTAWNALPGTRCSPVLTERPDLTWNELIDEVFDPAEFDVSISGSYLSPAARNLDRTQLWVLLRLMAVGGRHSARPIVIVDDTCGHVRTRETRMNGVLLTETACEPDGFLEAAMDAIGDYADRAEQVSASTAVLEELRSVAEAFAVHLPDDKQEEPNAIIYVDDPTDVAPLLKFEGRAVEQGGRNRRGTGPEQSQGNIAVIDPPFEGPTKP